MYAIRSYYGLAVLDDVLGRLGDDVAFGVEARTSRTAGDLVELTRGEVSHALAVELHERREEDGADRDRNNFV